MINFLNDIDIISLEFQDKPFGYRVSLGGNEINCADGNELDLVVKTLQAATNHSKEKDAKDKAHA